MSSIDTHLLNNKEYNSAIKLSELFHKNGYELYLVGGCVRDMLMGKVPNDFDMCTNAKPNEIIDLLYANNIRLYSPGLKFGTIIAVVDKFEFEITTYRSESQYCDGRHPEDIKFVLTIDEDLSRRDFTINAIVFNTVSKELIDLFNGQRDIKNNIIRTVGNADDRFSEDALRIIRALRFAVRYGFSIEENTLNAMRKNIELLDKVSRERVTSELEKIFSYNKPVRELFTACDFIIKQIFPEIAKCIGFKQHNKYHTHTVYEHMLYVVDYCNTDKFEIKIAALLHDIGKPDTFERDMEGQGHFYGHPAISKEICEKMLLERLRLTTEQYNRVLELVEYHDFALTATKQSVKRALNKFGEDFLYDWFILKQADMDDHIYPNKNHQYIIDINGIKSIMQELKEEDACFKIKDLKIDGNDIMKELGLKPGKQVGKILQSLLEEVIDEKIINDHEVLITRAKELNR